MWLLLVNLVVRVVPGGPDRSRVAALDISLLIRPCSCASPLAAAPATAAITALLLR
jgi:hypothetical protein